MLNPFYNSITYDNVPGDQETFIAILYIFRYSEAFGSRLFSLFSTVSKH